MADPACSDRSDLLQIRRGMGELNLLLNIIPQWCLLALEILEHIVRQHFVDGAHAIRAFGVARSSIVINEAGMSYQKRGHGRGDPAICGALVHPHVSAIWRKG